MSALRGGYVAMPAAEVEDLTTNFEQAREVPVGARYEAGYAVGSAVASRHGLVR